MRSGARQDLLRMELAAGYSGREPRAAGGDRGGLSWEALLTYPARITAYKYTLVDEVAMAASGPGAGLAPN